MSCQKCSRRQIIKVGAQLVAGVALSTKVIEALSGCAASHSTESNPSITTVTNNPINQYTLDFATYPQLETVGGAIVTTINASSGSTTISVVRTGVTTAEAVSVFCTHQGCQLNAYNSTTQTYICPCHGAVFAVTGAVMSGPISQPLPSFTSVVSTLGVVVTVT